VVSGILHGADAHIQVLSQLGEGSTFRLLFPAVYQPSAEWVNPAQEIACSENKPSNLQEHALNVCVIDDEQQDICALIEMELTLLGYLVKTFDNSLNAADYLREHLDEFDAVITAYGMPRLNRVRASDSAFEKAPTTAYCNFVQHTVIN
jgi:PleD family two-component response regulator